MASVLLVLASICLAAVILNCVRIVVHRLFFDELARFPGPPLAAWTDLAHVAWLFSERGELPAVRLHRKWGRVVRIAPNKVFFSDPQAALDIYGTTNGLKKSDLYLPSAPTAYGTPVQNFFVSQDVEYHDRIRRVAMKAFANTAKHELAVDINVAEFLKEMRARVPGDNPEGTVLDFSEWTNFFAMDAISRIAYDEPVGFMRAGADFNDMIATTGKFVLYAHYVGAAPWLDKIFLKNPLLMWMQKVGLVSSESAPVAVALARQQARFASAKAQGGFTREHGDMLDSFIEASYEKPDIMNEMEVLKIGINVVLAGGDTTAALICTLFHALARDSALLKQLLAEFDALPWPITYSQARKLPFFEACVLEAKRMYSVIRWTAERVVPPGGLVIGGEHLPGGTIVGANAFAVSRDTELYGADADIFRPARWLETDSERRRQMERCLPIFGYGRYECPGRHIVYVEVMKLFPAFLREFTIEDATSPGDDWYPSDGAIARPMNVKLRVKRRSA